MPDPQMPSTFIALLRERAATCGNQTLYRYLLTGDCSGPVEEWTYAQLDLQNTRAVFKLLHGGLPIAVRSVQFNQAAVDFFLAESRTLVCRTCVGM